ncbi:GMP synthase [Zalerion maritima]|uniref:GMP synthase n=1 Tax=Zalerion maritima TaxID=339359 RepID=A0AAD5RVP7_9PEZI|nr:GMP synthase [Zalerion maritima]
MPDYKDILKKGWHPEQKGATFKGQVKGLLGRSESPAQREPARPLSSLRDPNSFAPPPKRAGTAGSYTNSAASPSSSLPSAPPPPYDQQAALLAPPGQHEAPQYRHQQQEQQYGHEQQPLYAEEQDEPPPEPKPYRVDTTGLSTSHLPPPPVHRDRAGVGGVGVANIGASVTPARPPPVAPSGRAPPPALPPRLPPRNPSASLASSTSAPSPVAPVPPPSKFQLPSGSGASGQMSELKSRFGKMSSRFSSSSGSGDTRSGAGAGATPSAPSPPPAQGTTWAQKQAALRTASNFQKDPSSVSLSDARSAASTANNLRERHGEQVASGVQTAGRLNEKYGIANKVGHYTGNTSANQGAQPGNSSPGLGGYASSGNLSAAAGMLGKKKPPPPPPPKKKAMSGAAPADSGEAPPPVPMSTRPAF